ncbi:GNAT family N-acetyltransferase [Streptomyces antibioticus]|uniref:GNAT family N-acetyltransferase n=1 Tax=Streptomyces antibioticus TaxID=1890 RepID=UPI00225260DE|nr:GNAT family N-acetyltransferase [Streptomyces antibioticus]MCX5173780.1 GNAT family N-acetyltransferase [Streptomyces antibioticus]
MAREELTGPTKQVARKRHPGQEEDQMANNGTSPHVTGQRNNRSPLPRDVREPTSAIPQLPVSSLLLDPPPLQMTTRDNRGTLTRMAYVDDLDQVNEMHARCSLESCYARYHAARQTVTPREWWHLCDRANGTTLITTPLHDPSRVIAVTHLLRTSAPHVRELGILVEDSWQGQGLGTVLTDYMVTLARTYTLDCRAITAMTGRGNQRMLSILRGLNAEVDCTGGPTVDALIRVEE